VSVSLADHFDDYSSVFFLRPKLSDEDLGETVLLQAFAGDGLSYDGGFTPSVDGLHVSLSAAWMKDSRRHTSDRKFVAPYFRDLEGKSGVYSYKISWKKGRPNQAPEPTSGLAPGRGSP
jgi:hypothetical protein